VSVNDRVGNAVVRKIEINRVVLDRNGVEEVLSLDPQESS
jgi:hypothetical protein